MTKRMIGIGMIVVILLTAGLACQLSGGLPGGSSEDTPADTASGGDSAASPGTMTEGEGSTAPGTTADEGDPASVVTEAAIRSQPVPFNQGLASLNSYRLLMITDFSGPTSFDKNSMEMELIYSADLDARLTRTTNISSSEESPEPFESISEVIQVGNEMCSGSEEEWEYETLEPMAREAADAMGSLVDFLPMINDPEFIGEENLNGVMVNHFRFRLPGMGGESGALATLSDGEYWLAQDGNYLVKYQFSLELRSGPEGDSEADVVQGIMAYELTEINQPMSVTLPAECLAAAAEEEGF